MPAETPTPSEVAQNPNDQTRTVAVTPEGTRPLTAPEQILNVNVDPEQVLDVNLDSEDAAGAPVSPQPAELQPAEQAPTTHQAPEPPRPTPSQPASSGLTPEGSQPPPSTPNREVEPQRPRRRGMLARFRERGQQNDILQTPETRDQALMNLVEHFHAQSNELIEQQNPFQEKTRQEKVMQALKTAGIRLAVGGLFAGATVAFGWATVPMAIAGFGVGYAASGLARAGVDGVRRVKGIDKQEEEWQAELREHQTAVTQDLRLAADKVLQISGDAQIPSERREAMIAQAKLEFFNKLLSWQTKEEAIHGEYTKTREKYEASKKKWKWIKFGASLAAGILAGGATISELKHQLADVIQQKGIHMTGHGFGKIGEHAGLATHGHNVHMLGDKLVFDYNPGELEKIQEALAGRVQELGADKAEAVYGHLSGVIEQEGGRAMHEMGNALDPQHFLQQVAETANQRVASDVAMLGASLVAGEAAALSAFRNFSQLEKAQQLLSRGMQEAEGEIRGDLELTRDRATAVAADRRFAEVFNLSENYIYFGGWLPTLREVSVPINGQELKIPAGTKFIILNFEGGLDGNRIFIRMLDDQDPPRIKAEIPPLPMEFDEFRQLFIPANGQLQSEQDVDSGADDSDQESGETAQELNESDIHEGVRVVLIDKAASGITSADVNENNEFIVGPEVENRPNLVKLRKPDGSDFTSIAKSTLISTFRLAPESPPATPEPDNTEEAPSSADQRRDGSDVPLKEGVVFTKRNQKKLLSHIEAIVAKESNFVGNPEGMNETKSEINKMCAQLNAISSEIIDTERLEIGKRYKLDINSTDYDLQVQLVGGSVMFYVGKKDKLGSESRVILSAERKADTGYRLIYRKDVDGRMFDLSTGERIGPLNSENLSDFQLAISSIESELYQAGEISEETKGNVEKQLDLIASKNKKYMSLISAGDEYSEKVQIGERTAKLNIGRNENGQLFISFIFTPDAKKATAIKWVDDKEEYPVAAE